MRKSKKIGLIIFVILIVFILAFFAALIYLNWGDTFPENGEALLEQTVSFNSDDDNDSRSMTISDAQKQFTTSADWQDIGGNLRKISITQTVVWSAIPDERFSDLFIVNFNRPVSANQRTVSSMQLHIDYNRIVDEGVVPVTETHGADDLDFDYSDEVLAVRFAFPGGNISNVVVSLNADLYIAESFAGVTLITCYAHQYNRGGFVWDNFSFGYPNISYRKSIWRDDPVFSTSMGFLEVIF